MVEPDVAWIGPFGIEKPESIIVPTKNALSLVHDTYLELIKQFPLVPIRDAGHLHRAIEMINALTDRKLDDSEQEYQDALAMLVQVHENELPGFNEVAPADVMRHLLESNGDTQSTLSSRAGISKSLVSER